MNIFDVNWLAVVLAAIGAFMVGGIWYGPIMGKRWLGAVGLNRYGRRPTHCCHTRERIDRPPGFAAKDGA